MNQKQKNWPLINLIMDTYIQYKDDYTPPEQEIISRSIDTLLCNRKELTKEEIQAINFKYKNWNLIVQNQETYFKYIDDYTPAEKEILSRSIIEDLDNHKLL